MTLRRTRTDRGRRWCDAGMVACLALMTFAISVGLGQARERSAVASTPHFAFYSDFATNLNDALFAAGVARNRDQPELFHAGDERSCFAELPASARAGWDRAVDYYAEIVSPGSWLQREQYLLRMYLAGLDDHSDDPPARQFVEITESFGAAATPAYAACRWPDQDAENRRWIEDLTTRLAVHEQRIANRLERLYRRPWNDLPFIVDVVQTVSWSGANSLFPDSAGAHLLISDSYQGADALEIVFHESSHQWMLRGNPLPVALEKAASELDVALPDDLWHIVLFFTTGEVVRHSLDEAGEPGYVPQINAIFERGEAWARYRQAIESTWPAYLSGQRELSTTAADLIRALPEPRAP